MRKVPVTPPRKHPPAHTHIQVTKGHIPREKSKKGLEEVKKDDARWIVRVVLTPHHKVAPGDIILTGQTVKGC